MWGRACRGKSRKNEKENMVIATAQLESIAPYSQSQGLKTPKKAKEPFEKYEAHVWRERMNTDANGKVIIPAMAFKNCLTSIAQYLSETVPGKGSATYTKHFKAGVIVAEPVQLGIDSKTVEPEMLFLPSNGKTGGGSRVWKTFPLIPKWSGMLTVHILDETITEELFKKYLQQAGNFVGVGRFRPQSNGFYGRFKVNKINFEVLED